MEAVNLGMLLDLAADGLGDRIAFGSRADGLSYARIRDLASAAAPRLAASGADTLALLDETGPCVPVALFAAAWAGMSYAPLNFKFQPDYVRQLLDRLGDTFVVYGRQYHAALSGAGEVAVEEAESWLDDLGADDSGGAYADEPGRPAVLLFTSGTSAAPKAAVLEHDHLLAYILNSVEFGSASEDDAVLLSVPPFHIAGVAGVLSAIYAGRRIVPLARFTPEDWVRLARDEGVTHAMVVPTMLDRIVACMEADPKLRVPTMRNLVYGGARMPIPVLERALELFPNAGFVNAYGLTETSSTVALLGPADHRTAFAGDRKGLASIGKPLPGIEFECVDEDGKAVAPEVEGRIRIRGDQVSGKYVGQDGGVDAEGWLITGD